MPTFKNTVIKNNELSLRKMESLVKPAVIKRNNSARNIFDNENTSEMLMEIIVWLLVVGLVIFSM